MGFVCKSRLYSWVAAASFQRERERERESVQDIEGLSRKGVGILVRMPLKKTVGVVVECHLDTVYVFSWLGLHPHIVFSIIESIPDIRSLRPLRTR